MTERDVFLAALSLPDPAARSAYIDRACGADARLRARVEELFLCHAAADSFLAAPAFAPPPSPADATQTLGGASDAGGDATRTVGRAAGESDGPDDAVGPVLAFLDPPTSPDALGRLGRYELLEVLGAGGFGVVFRAIDETLRRVVAVKVMAPALAATSPARKRFLREARAAAAVKHECVVQVHAVEESPIPHLVMEFVAGETLQQRIDRTGPLDPAEAVRFGRQLAEGLAAAHATGLIHRDVKPSNVLVDGGPERAIKLTDFGLARAADDASLTRSGVVAGTPLYMAPEQARGEALDHRADLFSLGSVLYVMLAGRPPFRAASTLAVLKRVAEDLPRPIREVVPEVPEWLARVVGKLHAKEPSDRFQSARETAGVLADCEAQMAAHGTLKDYALIPGGQPKASRWPGRRGWVTAAAATALVLAVAGLYLPGTPRPPRPGEHETDPARPPNAAGDGFLPLFNGTDLAGWATHPQQQGEWRVADGAITGRGGRGYLFTDRDDFKNFHLRAEVRIGQGGNGGIFVRCRYGLGLDLGRTSVPFGYEVEVAPPGGAGGAAPTGSVYRLSERYLAVNGHTEPTPADEWFTLEVIAVGSRLTTRVDGRETLVFDDPDRAYDRGRLAIQTNALGAAIQVRKLEVKALPDTPPGPPTTGVSDFRAAHRLDPAGLAAWLKALPPGFRPAAIAADADAVPPRFNAVAVRETDAPAFELSVGVRSEHVLDDFNRHAKGGWRPDWTVEYAEGGATRRTIVWVRRPGGWEGLALPKGNPESFGAQRAKGLRPITPHVGGKVEARYRNVFAATFVPAAGIEWEARCDLTAEQFAAAVADARKRGWRPCEFDAASYDGKVFYTAVFESNPHGVPWDFRANLTTAGLDAAIAELRVKGMRPLVVSSRSAAEDPRYTAVWVGYDAVAPITAPRGPPAPDP